MTLRPSWSIGKCNTGCKKQTRRWRAPDCNFTKLIEWQVPESWLYPVTVMHTRNHGTCNLSSCAWCIRAAQTYNSTSIALPVKRPSVTSIGFVTTQSSPPLYTLFQTLSATLLTGLRHAATTVAIWQQCQQQRGKQLTGTVQHLQSHKHAGSDPLQSQRSLGRLRSEQQFASSQGLGRHHLYQSG